MNIKLGLLAAIFAVTLSTAGAQELPEIPKFERSYSKTGNLLGKVLSSEAHGYWRSTKHTVTNSPARQITVMHGYAEFKPKISDYEVSLGFISRVDSANGVIESIVYSYLDKRNVSSYDSTIGRKWGLDLSMLKSLDHDIIYASRGYAVNPERGDTTSLEGALDFQTSFFEFRENLRHGNDTVSIFYKHEPIRMSVQTSYEDGMYNVSLDMTRKVKGRKIRIVPGLDFIKLRIGAGNMPVEAIGEGSIIGLPVKIGIAYDEE